MTWLNKQECSKCRNVPKTLKCSKTPKTHLRQATVILNVFFFLSVYICAYV